MLINCRDLGIIKGENIEKIYIELTGLKTSDVCWGISVSAHLNDEDEFNILTIYVSSMNFAGKVAKIIQRFLFTVITKGIDTDFTRLPKYGIYNPLQEQNLSYFTDKLLDCADDGENGEFYLVLVNGIYGTNDK